ncbi:sporulation protein, partial [Apiospora phragmitis]
MAPIILEDESLAAIKRKREANDFGKSTPKKSKLKHKDALRNGTSSVQTPTKAEAGLPARHGSHRKNKAEKKLGEGPLADAWKVSQPIGGRMLDIDAILTEDEQHLVLAYSGSIQVYNTADSLLLRKIPIKVTTKSNEDESIVAMCLSRTSPNMLWVASSAGRIWKIDWTTGSGSNACLKLECDLLSDLEVDVTQVGSNAQDVLLVSMAMEDKWHVLACDVEGLQLKATKTVVDRTGPIQNLRFLWDGQFLAASSGKDIIIGTLNSPPGHLSRSFDLRVAQRVHLTKQSQVEMGDQLVLDVVVGCARGGIFYYNDILPQLRLLHKAANITKSLQPRRLHWHRKAVHAVKWSRDGNYIISGGSESVLIQWQLDTNKKDPLPHLAGSIENIVVSTKGSSYVVHLDDNSTMVLSTAEMKPITYVSGIQTLVTPPPPSKDNIVTRIGNQRLRSEFMRIPATIDPAHPSHLLLGVANGQQIVDTGAPTSIPMLQTVEMSTVQGIAKQPLTRTHPTDVNITPKGQPLTEPRVTHLESSFDGKWLATVDEWLPPSRDVSVLDAASAERREVHLKFWMPGKEDSGFELVSRINGPHYTGRSEHILDLSADPSSHRFATLGEDGVVRFWQPVVRERDGLVLKNQAGRQLEQWTCIHTVHLHETKPVGITTNFPQDSSTRSGALSFSLDGSTVADDLVVYNVVLDELSYGIRLSLDDGSAKSTLLIPQLAVDYASEKFAVAMSRPGKHGTIRSELATFGLDQSEPETLAKFSYPIVSLMTAPGSTGFVVLDAAAQIWSVSQRSQTGSVTLAQPLADIDLDKVEETAQPTDSKPLALFNDAEEASDDEMELDGPQEDADMSDAYPVVVPPRSSRNYLILH